MSINRTEMKTVWTVALAAAVFVGIQLGGEGLENALGSVNRYAMHLFLESLAFAVCFALLILGWMVFVPTLCRQRLMTAALFAGVGLLGLLHAISAPGMPLYDPAAGASPSKLLEWIAEWAGALGLLVVFSLERPIVKPRTRIYAIVSVIATVAVAAAFVFRTERWNEAAISAFEPVQQALALLFYGAAIAVILYRNRFERPQSMLTVVQALIWLLLAKAEKTLGAGIGTPQDLFGEMIKLVGYYFLLKGIYLVLIEEPYKRQKKTEARIHYLAFHDELTGLPNRRLFSERLRAEMDRSAAAGKKFALLWLDLDRFKTINDSMGHSFGDLLLTSVSERLTAFADKPENVFGSAGTNSPCSFPAWRRRSGRERPPSGSSRRSRSR